MKLQVTGHISRLGGRVARVFGDREVPSVLAPFLPKRREVNAGRAGWQIRGRSIGALAAV